MMKSLLTMFAPRVALAALLSTLVVVTAARAHEVQPGIMDIEFQANEIEVFIEWVLEAPVAGVDLENLDDTNASDKEEDYLRLRALPPAEMEAAFRAAWPGLAQKLTFQSGELALQPELIGVTIPDVGNIELSRTSTIQLAVPLPDGNEPVTIGWTKDLGNLIVRQRTIEDGYAAFLTPGQMSDPIPRSSAGPDSSDCTGWLCRFTSMFGG